MHAGEPARPPRYEAWGIAGATGILWGAAATQGIAALGAAISLAIVVALSVRDSARAVRSLTRAVERLTERQEDDHDRLGRIEATVTPWPPARRPQARRRVHE
jgi:hypothetical protein